MKKVPRVDLSECSLSEIGSARRNPVIADLFHRMKYMERRGSGIKKIIAETEKLPRYDDRKRPSFYSTHSAFFVTLRNMNYAENACENEITPQVTPQDKMKETILVFCNVPRSRKEIAEYCGYKDIRSFAVNYLRPLLDEGRLKLTIPEKPTSSKQRYVAVK